MLAGGSGIDLIPTADCPSAEDQRGSTRPVPPGGGCDAGAVEADNLPDTLIAKGSEEAVGDGVYNDDGTDQTVSAKVRRGKSVTFGLRVQNDAQVSVDSFRIEGPGSNKHFTVKYLRDGDNVTRQVTRNGIGTGELTPGEQMIPIKVRVRAKKDAPKGKKRRLKITATSGNFPDRADTVVAEVKAK
jgi:hypothetical protein